MNAAEHPNQQALYQAINIIYINAMRPFILRNLKKVRHLSPEDRFQNAADIDVKDCAYLVRRYWRDAFEQQFDPDRDVRSTLNLITEVRNRVAHPSTTDIEAYDAISRLSNIAEVLGQINAPEEKRKVEAIRDTVLTRAQRPPKRQRPARRRTSDLKPWREVIKPNDDVTSGDFQKSEFAADLQEVFEGRAKTAEYGETDVFFNQTYITPGLKDLLVNTLRRIGRKGGAPVVQLKTGFGGGKTHSLIALYHLVTGMNVLQELPLEDKYTRLRREITEIMEEAEWDAGTPIDAKLSVLVGTYLSTTDSDETAQGDPLNTLWGKMADQLGGQDAYNIVRNAAVDGTAPGGNQLDKLFEHVGPSVILIDELLAYVRNVQGVTQESIYTFLQALTESVNRSTNVTLVATLPESDTQAGGEGGIQVLDTLEEILARIEAVSIPLAVDNAFEVVRRRLFSTIIDETAQDETCETFRRMYNNARGEYPDGVSDQNYLQRMKSCYPIHPEVFDRLFEDWAVIPGFQKTRGILRMMAVCISRLYQEKDTSPLILPGNLPLDDPALAVEFVRELEKSGGNWNPAVEEVDSHGSRTDQIDQQSQVFKDVGGAARRIARTVFFGSASAHNVKGLTTRQIHLGVVEPGQGVSTYNDALNRMTGNLYYLYNRDDRYYFHTQENLNKVALDRAGKYTDTDIHDEIVSHLELAIGRDPNVRICPTSPEPVKDRESLQYVVLHPSVSLPSRSKEEDTAEKTALNILKYSGDDEQHRTFKNTLLFITAKRDDIRELSTHVKDYRAWSSIINGDDLHGQLQELTGERLNQATQKLEAAGDAVKAALFRAYRWGLIPYQSDPQKADYDFSHTETGTEDGKIMKRFQDKFAEAEAITPKIAPDIFAGRLQQYIWSSEQYKAHIKIDDLWELIAQHVYMPRLKDRNVLETCIKEGVAGGVFGCASDHTDDGYRNVRFQEQMSSIRIDKGTGYVLINSEVARVLKEKAEEAQRKEKVDTPDTPGSEETDDGERSSNPDIREDEPPIPPPTGPTHIVITKALQLEMSFGEEMNILQDEIARTLSDAGGKVTVEIKVTAEKADGFSENTIRAIKDNSKQLEADLTSH